MTDKEIGQTFYQIAKILELGNPADRFRIIAYERAAQTIENYAEEMKDVYRKGGIKALNDIPDVGGSIAEKIEELLKTGKLKYLDEIKKDVPVSEVEFLKIPGVGPKTAIKITKELKAKNIDDLEKKLKSGKGDELFKAKTATNILRGIQIMKRMTGRMLITEALPLAEEIVTYLKKVKGVEKIDYVGSLRRMKETIGDIDIIAASSNPRKLIEEFIKFPGISQVLTKGETKSTVIHNQKTQIDLEILPADEYGSLLQHFTGSKEHNVAMRTYAQTKNMSFSEHGFKFEGKLHKFTTEKKVYNFLGMDFIEPELRENTGEIEAALKHKLPKLVELTDIKSDLHVHSNWSDGAMTISEIVRAAEKLGYEYIVISDHTVGLGIANGLDEKRLELRQKEIEKVQKIHPKIKILSSVEVNIKADGDLDIKDWMLEKLDIVTASVHTSFFQDKETMTNRLIKAINHPHVDIIGHPSGRIIGQREPYEVDWSQVFRACKETGTVLEISAFPNRLDLKDSLCREAKSYGVKFAISTDSHQAGHLELMRFGVAVARRGWLEKEDIVNSRDVNSLILWSKRSGHW
ncbi:MAG: PHP domain/helix-hairpin-helix motif protein [Berkelbacteria bacterium GW2011_GWA1_39_10]|uniref:DNA polymerase beta n=1 Tax=Berkelbacteria bacterium GW2011_GWA1_39_10 TaxID=1618332 RepID=A0A0G0LHI8_9BACT|nr:MAG: PHP domain/helix-hairpin-helix motif protein [Berkelbacteria bacterium GW2011_GWA1_39_10]